MTGILGLFDRRASSRGGADDRRGFERMAHRLKIRAPDGLDICLAPPMAMARAFLDTGAQSWTEPGLIVDGAVTLAADVRLDERAELRRQLDLEGCATSDEVTDERLVLLAWRVWGLESVARLRGDFALVLWDAAAELLVAARDLFGIRPLYVAHTDRMSVVSNSLEPILSHAEVSRDKDALGMLDYLLFDSNFEAEGTIWRQIRRVPPGCLMIWQGENHRTIRFAEPWIPRERPMSANDRVEDFVDALSSAVRDRMRPGEPISISMSGGLDSTALAALAHEQGFEPHLHTLVYERAISDQEGSFAAQVAEHLQLPHHLCSMDSYSLFERCGELPWTPMPGDAMVDAIYSDFDSGVIEQARTVLTGWGGDPLFLSERRLWLRRLRAWRPDLALLDVARSLWTMGRLPPLGLHTAIEQRRLKRSWRQGFPAWLEPGFARRMDAEQRWRSVVLGPSAAVLSDPERRPEARRFTFDLQWSHVFERVDAGNRGLPLQRRHPFFDRRVVERALAAPSSPWCVDKYLLRRAMTGRLPEPVRIRPKSPQVGDPEHPVAGSLLHLFQDWVTACPEIEEYVCPAALLAEMEEEIREPSGREKKLLPVSAPWRRPLNLAAWLARATET